MKTNIMLPPNKQMDVSFEFSERPSVFDYLLFFDYNSNGNFVVGTADLCGTFWEGNVLFFQSLDDMVNLKHSKHYIHNTASDGKFISTDLVAIAEDTGILNILSIDDSSTLKPQNYFRHSKQISEIDIWTNSSEIATCFGRNLAVWDINSNEKRPIVLFENVHTDTINSISTLKDNVDIIFSASSDRRACVWDKRGEKPLVLYSNEFSSLTKIVTNPNDANLIAIGTQAGDVYILDQREPGEFLSTFHCFNKSVSCLEFNELQQLGVSGDKNEVLVFDHDDGQYKTIYKNTEHQGHVKDIKWFHDMLLTCGFGQPHLLKHRIQKNVNS